MVEVVTVIDRMVMRDREKEKRNIERGNSGERMEIHDEQYKGIK